MSIPKVSLILPSFRRAALLDIGLSSISKYPLDFDMEIIVVNDGVEDETKDVCEKYKEFFDIKYIFSGQRNISEIKPRNPSFAINIGVKRCNGEILVLSCPEIYHIGDSLNKIVNPLLINKKFLTTPEIMFFDNFGHLTFDIQNKKQTSFTDLKRTPLGKTAIEMPFLMGMWKYHFIDIGGYDEDFIGYAADDNDFTERLLLHGLVYHKVSTSIIHLFHGKIITGGAQWDNPLWVYNYNLYLSKKGQVFRNTGRDWGVL